MCTRTGLTSRYFYENFRSTDELAETAYDTCVTDIAAAVTTAFAGPTEIPAQIENAMTALVASLEANPRAGHVLFSHRIDNQLISRKRQESTAFFAQITASTAEASIRSTVDLGQAAHFVVGGVTQLLSTWLNDTYSASTSPNAGTDAEPPTTDGPSLDGPGVARLATTMISALATQLAEDTAGH